MNYHSKEWIMEQVGDHYKDALELYPEDRIVGVFYQGSGNYDIDYKDSDVDTKVILLPSFDDIIRNRTPVSTTYVRANNEHIDFKDIRLMFECFKKQNTNYLEILFTRFKILNPAYEKEMMRIIGLGEQIARYDTHTGVKAICGMAYEKLKALEHRYPSIAEKIERFGYDPKQLCHIVRLEAVMKGLLCNEPYGICLRNNNDFADYLIAIKKGETYTSSAARKVAKETVENIKQMKDWYIEHTERRIDKEVENEMYSVLYTILRQCFKNEL